MKKRYFFSMIHQNVPLLSAVYSFPSLKTSELQILVLPENSIRANEDEIAVEGTAEFDVDGRRR